MAENEYTQRVGVGAIILNSKNKILLGIRNVEDNKGKWELLGGLVENKESLVAGIKREVDEEAGVEIEPLVIVGNYDRYFEEEGNRNIGFTFLCKLIAGEPHQTKFGRVAGFQWVSMDEAFKLQLTPYTKLQLENYQTWLETAKLLV